MASFFFTLLSLLILSSPSFSVNVSYDSRAIIINGQRRIIISGSIHYPRSTPEMWPDLIEKAREGGLDAIETYVFWNAHERRPREYNFENHLDLVRFIKTIQAAGLYAVLRIGPYVCAEWNYGGLPVWLHQIPGIGLRTDNEIFKYEMQKFTTLVVNMLRRENLFASQGGPIILAQIENEYGNVESSYGVAGKRYVQWCASMAESLKIGVPWIMCQQSDAPLPMLETCNGFYCHSYSPSRNDTPKMWTENWTGWFKAWGGSDPSRPAEDVAFAVARFFQRDGTFQNYYMYHGGTNFGRTTGGPYITTSYDYDAPLDEYGNLRQPKWGHLKNLHALLHSMEKLLVYGSRTSTEHGKNVWVTRFVDSQNNGCFLSNENMGMVNVSIDGRSYRLPGWSVSILPDCKTEAYNTAKVSAQTSVIVKKPSDAEEEPMDLKWVWKPEEVAKNVVGESKDIVESGLRDQISVTGDASDYLWYMTGVNLRDDDFYNRAKGQMILRVNTTGHVLHVFVNGVHAGSQYGTNGKYQFIFESLVQVKEGPNDIALLSATVGLTNYGAFFDQVPTGIVGGPVLLIGNENKTMDLSSNTWRYKVGLNGEDEQLYAEESLLNYKWQSENLPINRMLTWYKTTFKAPLGTEPVVVDLKSLGKGSAWVNGHGIGRYWSFASAQSGCGPCDYRGKFSSDKCKSRCGHTSQRWYHVPRSFLQADTNILTLFEEFGGNPTEVSFHTVTVGTVCASVSEGKTLQLECSGNRRISEILFSSYGDASGTCGSFIKGNCDSENVLTLVKQACIGRRRCEIEVSDQNLGMSSCSTHTSKNLVVQVAC